MDIPTPTNDELNELLDGPDKDTEIKEQRSGIPQGEPEVVNLPKVYMPNTTKGEVYGPPNPATGVIGGMDKPAPAQAIVAQPQPAQIQAYKTTQTDFMNPIAYQQMKLMAIDFMKSEALPKGFANAEQVLVCLQAGREMGMKPFESINSLYFVNGSLNIWGKATMRRLREHGWNIQYSETDNKGGTCTATVSKGNESFTDSYSFEDAEASGYVKDSYGKPKIGWRPGLNRKLKLRYGVLSLIIKSYIPEVLGTANNIVEVQEDAEIPQGVTVGGKALTPPERTRKAVENSEVASAVTDKLKNLGVA